jgi:hypothetical protein
LRPLEGYKRLESLGHGANDFAQLMEDPNGRRVVALSPLENLENSWVKTSYKGEKVTKLEQEVPGVGKFLVHELDRGMFHFDGYPESRPVLIVEYAGESIENLKTDEDKLDAIKQMHECMILFHGANMAIDDIKIDHWTYIRDEQGKIKVKLIDNSKIRKEGEGDKNTRRYIDLVRFCGIVEEMLPWYRLPPELNVSGDYNEDKYSSYSEKVNLMMQDLEHYSQFSGRQKAIERLKRGVGLKRM